MTTNALNTGHGHMIARVNTDADGTTWWACGSASGPMGEGWIDEGPLKPGQYITLGFNYDTDEYGAFPCKIERINRVTVSVQSVRTGQRHRVEI